MRPRTATGTGAPLASPIRLARPGRHDDQAPCSASCPVLTSELSQHSRRSVGPYETVLRFGLFDIAYLDHGPGFIADGMDFCP